MDLRGIANRGANVVNPDITVSVQRSIGYSIGAGQRQVPLYATPAVGPAQVQALSSDDVKQLDGLNIQGTLKAIYLRGALAGVVRPDGTGGDIVTFGGQSWLVVKVLEAWPTWTKAVIVLQESSVPVDNTIIVNSNPGITSTSSYLIPQLTLRVGVPQVIVVRAWTTLDNFARSIVFGESSVDGYVNLSLLANGIEYTSRIIVAEGAPTGFADSGWPALLAASSVLTFTSETTLTLDVTLCRGVAS